MGRTLKVFHPDTEAPGKPLNLPSRALGLTVAPLSFEDLSRRRQPDFMPPRPVSAMNPSVQPSAYQDLGKKKKKKDAPVHSGFMGRMEWKQITDNNQNRCPADLPTRAAVGRSHVLPFGRVE